MAKSTPKKLSTADQSALLKTLKTRFEKHMNRHKGIKWEQVEERLLKQPAKLWSLNEMENTGGEPDVVDYNKKTGEYIFFDCSAESPKGRRSLCYDREGWESRKEHHPEGTAIDMADEMGVTLLSEDQYRYLHTLGEFDTKTNTWLLTPDDVRKLGGSIFGDYRFGRVFVYHNGAGSYYGVRGFRAWLAV